VSGVGNEGEVLDREDNEILTGEDGDEELDREDGGEEVDGEREDELTSEYEDDLNSEKEDAEVVGGEAIPNCGEDESS
jgi:hypothetical protein